MTSILSGSRIAIAASFLLSSLMVPMRTVSAAPADPSPSGYHEVARYTLGGDGGWDYLTCDSAGHRLFITRGSHVQVMDTESGKLIHDIPDAKGCHGVALAPKLKRGFISNGGGNSVIVFDTDTFQVIQTVPVGQNPDAILYDSATNHVFTFNGRSADTTVLDAASGKVVGTIPLGGKPEFAVSDGAGKVFVNIEDTAELLTLDPKALAVIKRTPLAPAEGPSGLAFDKKTYHLFAAGDNKHAAVVDGKTGKLIATPTIGDGPDAAVVDPASHLAFTSNGSEGTLSVLQETKTGTFTTETIPTQQGARTMTIDPETHRIYLVTAKFEPLPADAPAVNGRRPRPKMVPDSFVVLVYAPTKK